MSTKTTFKRIALVAVAALGLGVLSVAPSSAAVGTSATVTVTANGTATTKVSDSSTAGSFTVAYFQGQTFDTVTVSAALKSAPTGAEVISPTLLWAESVTAQGSRAVKDAATATNLVTNETVTAGTPIVLRTVDTSTVSKYVGGKFKLQMDTSTAGANTALTAGTYTFTVIVTPYDNGVINLTNQKLVDITYVVSKTTDASATSSAAVSTAVLAATAGSPTVSGVDDAISAEATAGSTAAGTVRVSLKNSASGNAQESITATITAGVIGDGTTFGRSVVLKYTDTAKGNGYLDLPIRPDGTAGVATISISTASVTFAAKTITFYAAAPKTITVKTNKPVIAVASATTNTDVVRATALDANGNVWGGQLYIQAVGADSATAGSTTPAACTFDPTYGYHKCPVSGQAAGTASLKVMDASNDLDGTITTADAAVISDAASVTVSTGVASKISISFDKSSYAPGEKAKILVTAVDAAGKALPGQTILNALAAGGITPSTAFSTGSAAIDSTTAVIAASTSSTSGTTAGSQSYTVYMPYSAGDVTISATGGNGVAAAGRVAISATASVVNSSVDAATDAANEATDAANAATDAALAAADAADAATAAAQDASDAVAALSATVAKLVASLKAQITSLTNLVIKIQKKVKA
jgi:hypothetical protein